MLIFGYSILVNIKFKNINFKRNERARLTANPLSFLSVDGHNSFNFDCEKKTPAGLFKLNPIVIYHFIMMSLLYM